VARRRPRSFLADTDIFIDYLNGVRRARELLDAPDFHVYYAAVTRKELVAKPELSATERRRIELLLRSHRLIPVDDAIAERFSRLLTRYAGQGLRKSDALVAATAWSRSLPLLMRNSRHYRFISEIKLLGPDAL
jgi:predicted nucleic acid-binding protein